MTQFDDSFADPVAAVVRDRTAGENLSETEVSQLVSLLQFKHGAAGDRLYEAIETRRDAATVLFQVARTQPEALINHISTIADAAVAEQSILSGFNRADWSSETAQLNIQVQLRILVIFRALRETAPQKIGQELPRILDAHVSGSIHPDVTQKLLLLHAQFLRLSYSTERVNKDRLLSLLSSDYESVRIGCTHVFSTVVHKDPDLLVNDIDALIAALTGRDGVAYQAGRIVYHLAVEKPLAVAEWQDELQQLLHRQSIHVRGVGAVLFKSLPVPTPPEVARISEQLVEQLHRPDSVVETEVLEVLALDWSIIDIGDYPLNTLIEIYVDGTTTDAISAGTIVDSIATETPEILDPHLESLVDHLDDSSPMRQLSIMMTLVKIATTDPTLLYDYVGEIGTGLREFNPYSGDRIREVLQKRHNTIANRRDSLTSQSDSTRELDLLNNLIDSQFDREGFQEYYKISIIMILTQITSEDPEQVTPHLGLLVNGLYDSSPTVRTHCAEVLYTIAETAPDAVVVYIDGICESVSSLETDDLTWPFHLRILLTAIQALGAARQSTRLLESSLNSMFELLLAVPIDDKDKSILLQKFTTAALSSAVVKSITHAQLSEVEVSFGRPVPIERLSPETRELVQNLSFASSAISNAIPRLVSLIAIPDNQIQTSALRLLSIVSIVRPELVVPHFKTIIHNYRTHSADHLEGADTALSEDLESVELAAQAREFISGIQYDQVEADAAFSNLIETVSSGHPEVVVPHLHVLKEPITSTEHQPRVNGYMALANVLNSFPGLSSEFDDILFNGLYTGIDEIIESAAYVLTVLVRQQPSHFKGRVQDVIVTFGTTDAAVTQYFLADVLATLATDQSDLLAEYAGPLSRLSVSRVSTIDSLGVYDCGHLDYDPQDEDIDHREHINAMLETACSSVSGSS